MWWDKTCAWPSFIEKLKYSVWVIYLLLKNIETIGPMCSCRLRDRVTVKTGPRHIVREMKDGAFEMTIKSAVKSDSGIYTCRIINEYGTKQCEAKLEVKGMCFSACLRMHKSTFRSCSPINYVRVSFGEVILFYIVMKCLQFLYHSSTWLKTYTEGWNYFTTSPFLYHLTAIFRKCTLFISSTTSGARSRSYPGSQGHHSQGWRDCFVWVSRHWTKGHGCGLACGWETDPASIAQL